MRLQHACSLLCLACAACPAGRDIPAETAMVPIQGATFKLGTPNEDGTPTRCQAGSTNESERCDCGSANQEPLAWIDSPGLSWVPRATASVAAFEIDEHEVTNLQYAYCVESGACTPPASSDIDGAPYYGASEHHSSPVVWVEHEQAAAYCAFVGKRLPNEAEWELAARGTEGRTYPAQKADETPTCVEAHPHFLVSRNCGRASPLAIDYSEADKIDYSVGDRIYRLYGMASNVSEWVLDAWSKWAYCADRQPYERTCQLEGTSCAACEQDGEACAKSCVPQSLVLCRAGDYKQFLGQDSGKQEWVVRGGSWDLGPCYLRLYVRRQGSQAQPGIGFRCAK